MAVHDRSPYPARLVLSAAMMVGACDGLAAFSDTQSDGWVDIEVPTTGPIGQCGSVEVLDGWVEDLRLAEGQCYYAPEGLTVAGRLTVAAGALVGFGEGTSLDVLSEGSLQVQGRQGASVLLTGPTGQAGEWAGVRFEENSQDNLLSGVEIEGAGAALAGANWGAAVDVGPGVEVLFEGVDIRRSAGAGIALAASAAAEGLSATHFEAIELDDIRWRSEAGGAAELQDLLGSACELGSTACAGNEVVGCVLGEWESLRDCTENVDSGRSQCVLYDGQAGCDEPPPHACTRLEEQLVSGIPLPDLGAHDDACVGPASCQEAGTRACLLVNGEGAPLTFEGTGDQWIDLVAYDNVAGGLRNQASGVRYRLQSEGPYRLEILVDQIVELDFRGFEIGRTDGDPCRREALASGTAGTAVWQSARHYPTRQKSMRVHVVYEGDSEDGSCERWSLKLEPNPCPAVEAPTDNHCP